jgi:hypothetical protein
MFQSEVIEDMHEAIDVTRKSLGFDEACASIREAIAQSLPRGAKRLLEKRQGQAFQARNIRTLVLHSRGQPHSQIILFADDRHQGYPRIDWKGQPT